MYRLIAAKVALCHMWHTCLGTYAPAQFERKWHRLVADRWASLLIIVFYALSFNSHVYSGIHGLEHRSGNISWRLVSTSILLYMTNHLEMDCFVAIRNVAEICDWFYIINACLQASWPQSYKCCKQSLNKSFLILLLKIYNTLPLVISSLPESFQFF